ncbi:MAG TPA: SIMPL domain-containing protein [Candidatus Paceibacterota bacterium]|nr:SIMPL domain-containing protein [Candidatus Paceibacterota bacterium]
MNFKTFFKSEMVSAATVLAIGLFLSAMGAAYTFYMIRTFDNTLSTTGSAKAKVTSDSVKWSASISRTVTEGNIKSGYAGLIEDLAIVKKFLTSKGIAESEITTTPVFTNEVYKYNPSGNAGPKEFTLIQNITINSTDVAKITEVAKNTQDIINRGVFFQNQSPEYYYSKLADLRVSLLGDAVKDAKARAEMLAKSGGRSIGAMKAASSGVVQVLAPNSIEVSDYGQYDTQSIEKEVMVTARASFVVR